MQANGTTKAVNTETVNYTYSADGVKHRMLVKTIYTDNTVVNEEKLYRGTMVTSRYWTETVSVPVTAPALAVEYILHPEGRTRFQTNGTPIYEYHLKDHLGNVRVAFEIDADGHAAPFQWNDYDPFGMVQENDYTFMATGATDGQLYKYNGKEEQNFGLNAWLDYGARMYNPALGRWHNVDPMLEKYYDYSPYNYCLNNPVNMIDPDGMMTTESQAPDTKNLEDKLKTLMRNQTSEAVTYTMNEGGGMTTSEFESEGSGNTGEPNQQGGFGGGQDAGGPGTTLLGGPILNNGLKNLGSLILEGIDHLINDDVSCPKIGLHKKSVKWEEKEK